MKSARAVTFNKKIKLKTVTTEGDSLDPNGVMSGGSKSSRRILESLHKLDMLLAKRKQASDELKPLRQRLETLRDASARFGTLNEELELKTHELSLVQKRCETSRFASLQTSLSKLDEQLESIEKELESANIKAKEQDKLAKSLKKEIENFEETRKAQLKAKEAEIATLKKDMTKCEKKCSKLDQEHQLHTLEFEQLQKDIESFAKQIEKSEENLGKIRDEVKELADKVEQERETYVVFEREAREFFIISHFCVSITSEEYHSHRSLIPQERITRKNQHSNTNSIMTKTELALHARTQVH